MTSKILKKYLVILGVIIILLFQLILVTNIAFTAWPEMTLWPYLVLKGWLPYKDIAIAHTPLLIAELSVFFKLFGVGLWQLKLYTWLLILVVDLVIFYVAKRLWNVKIALLSLLSYIFLQIYYEGNGLWFDLALALYTVLLFYLLKQKRWILAGIVWGLALVTKQTAVWFTIPVALSIYSGTKKSGEVKSVLTSILIGSIMVIGLFILVLFVLGIYNDFVFWGIKFGTGMLPTSSGQIKLPTSRQFTYALLPFLIFAFLFIKKKKIEAVELLAWAVFCALGFIPRWGMFHFQPAVPFIAIAFGLVFAEFGKYKKIFKYTIAIFVTLLLIVFGRSIARSWGQDDRFFEPETITVVDYLIDKTNANDRVYLVNTWDNIYALSDTLPASKPWVPYLPWYIDVMGVEDQIKDNLFRVPPDYIVVKDFTNEGLSSLQIKWFLGYIDSKYEMADKIGSHTIYTIKQ